MIAKAPMALAAGMFLLGHVSAGLGTLLENNQKRVQRITTLHYDLNLTDINILYDAQGDEDRSPYEQTVFDALAQRLHYEDMDAYVAEVREHMQQGDNVVIEGFFNESLGNAERMRRQNNIIFGIGGPIGLASGIVATKYRINPLWPRFKYVDKVYGAKVNSLMFDEIKAIRLDRAKGLISKAVMKEQIKDLRSAGKAIGGVGYKAALRSGFVDPTMATDILRITRNLKIGFRMLYAADFVFAFAGFIPLILEKIQGEEAKTDLQAAIREAVPLRFAMKKYHLQSLVWTNYKGRISAATDIWEALQAQADTGSACYLDMDLTLATQQDDFLQEFLDEMDAIDDAFVYNALQLEDEPRSQWTEDDPSLTEILQILEEMDAADAVEGEEDNDDAEYEGDIFDSPNLGEQPLPNDLIDGENVRYMELDGDMGALWKLTGPFWTYQEGPTNGVVGPRHRMHIVSRLPTQIELEIVDTNSDVTNAGKILTVSIQPGVAGSVSWADETESIAVTASTWSNLLEVNGWTSYYGTVLYDEVIKALNIEECSRTKGWSVNYDITGYGNAGLKETFRSKTVIGGTTIGGPPFAPVEIAPQFELDLATSKLKIWYSLGSDPTVLDVDPDSYLPRFVVT